VVCRKLEWRGSREDANGGVLGRRLDQERGVSGSLRSSNSEYCTKYRLFERDTGNASLYTLYCRNHLALMCFFLNCQYCQWI
jgi:hypothetical protein